METVTLNGQHLDYDVTGPTGDAAGGPDLLLLTGWCQDHRLFDRVLPPLARRHRVIRVDWRGHGADRSYAGGDFGVAEQADDVIALLDHLGVERVVPVSTSHGGWANMEITDRLGATRVPRSIVIDWLMLGASPEFVADLRASQDPETWVQARQNLFDIWLAMADNDAVAEHLDKEMASFDFDMWARSCRVIDDAYATWGSPLKRMAAFAERRPVLHLYSQPNDEAYHRGQADFSAENPWFSSHWVEGRTHFPTLESPEALAEQIEKFHAGA
ncbi:alpha/beta fold hydrolase [Spirillospora sp. CA-253888]